MSRQQSGFTIIELVVVIILLGILAATALPRFMQVDDEAHGAVVSGVQGSLQTGISLYHAQWVAQGKPDEDTAITAFGGLRVNEDGFPYSITTNAASEVTDSDDCQDVYVNILQAGAPTITTAVADTGVAAAARAGGDVFDFVAVRDGTNCNYHYTGQSASGTLPLLTYDSELGTITRGSAAVPAAP